MAWTPDQFSIEEVRKLASKSFHSSLSGRNTHQDVSTAGEALIEAFVHQIKTEAHLLNYALNQRAAHGHGLPRELWAAIWSTLGLDDRIVVTHVCHDWRTLALSSPNVWSDLCVRYWCDQRNGDCRDAARRYDSEPEKDEWTRLVVWPPLRAVKILLERGISTPLYFDATFIGDHGCVREEFVRLADELRGHAHRLARLQLRVATSAFIPLLFRRINLPYLLLRELVCSVPTLGQWNPWESVPVASQLVEGDTTFHAPQLQLLDLQNAGTYVPRPNASANLAFRQGFRHVREATLMPQSLDDVKTIVLDCPKIEVLRLNAVNMDMQSGNLVGLAAATLRDLHISEIRPSIFSVPDLGAKCPLFVSSSLRTLVIHLAREFPNGVWTIVHQEVLAQFWPIFSALRGPLDLTVSLKESNLIISARENSGPESERRTRIVDCSTNQGGFVVWQNSLLTMGGLLWNYLDISSVKTLTIVLNGSMYQEYSIGSAKLPNVDCLEIHDISNYSNRPSARLVHVNWAEAVPGTAKVKLKTFIVHGDPQYDTEHFFDDVESFQEWLGVNRPALGWGGY
ncbi:hypothetical protein BKA62DRAFT_695842 [Auriculariales sp. MPI-PUGE-AT-0066]|nr:hypothetical protein BKA62DRAFT_695842 [Auriculariales sp. MPI-PUGE-AT-0066]